MTALRGIYPIVPTPFDERGAVDAESIVSLARFMADRGVAGLAILGVMGEAPKLSGAERREVIRAFREGLPKERQLVVGVSGTGTDLVIQSAREAAELGADALLVGPVPVQNDDVLFEFYRRVDEAVDLPIVLHDYPESTKILLSPQLIAQMYKELRNVRYIKLEDPPTGNKMGRLRELGADGLGVFGALGGMYAFEELDRGALGIMTGFAYPELLVELQKRMDAGDRAGAAALFYDMVPLVRFEFQPGIGVALRKEILKRRGAIRHSTIRHPGGRPDAKTLEHLWLIIDHLRRRGLIREA